ncbi:hypothetical protein AW40_03000 [Kosakonia radicincitans UMEnt01/12]|nr:hypothetical protein AW40_03000 [Kosakonia radicincitans UMEnt01/12]
MREALKALFSATYREIDLAQFWRQKVTAKEVSGREEGHEQWHQQAEDKAVNNGRRYQLQTAATLEHWQGKIH